VTGGSQAILNRQCSLRGRMEESEADDSSRSTLGPSTAMARMAWRGDEMGVGHAWVADSNLRAL
jgi:hypothetical protein